MAQGGQAMEGLRADYGDLASTLATTPWGEMLGSNQVRDVVWSAAAIYGICSPPHIYASFELAQS